MKKIFAALILAVLVVLCGSTAFADGSEVIETGSCGEGLSWTLTRDGTLTISGEGNMESTPWEPYKNIIKTLVMEEGITSIANGAFKGYSGLTGTLDIPSTVKTIGGQAFMGCSGFTGSLVLPEGLKTINCCSTFEGCSGFTGDLILPEGLGYIGDDNTFYGCTGFDGKLYIPGSVSVINYEIFSGCSGFKELEIGYGVSIISNGAFQGCTGLTGELILPNSVTTIMGSAFKDCSGFTGELVLPSSLTSLNGSPFSGCGFTGYVIVPQNVNSISGQAFSGLDINEIIVSSSNTKYSSQDGILYNKDKTEVIACPQGKEGTVSLPYNVKKIGDYAFSGCSKLTGKIPISSYITSVGYNAFSGCSGFTGTFSLPSGLTYLGGGAFSGCAGLTGNVVIPAGITIIDSETFLGCEGLTGEVEISENITSVGEAAFAGTEITAINVSENNESYVSEDGILYLKKGKIYNEGKTLVCCPSGRTKPVVIAEGTTEFVGRALFGCDKIGKSIVLPESIKWLSGRTFLESSLTEFYAKGNAPKGYSIPGPFNEGSVIYYEPGTTDWVEFAEKHNATAIENSNESSINITSGAVTTGKNKKIFVEIEENSKAAMIQFTLKYDADVLKLVSCNAGELVEDAAVNSAVDGEIRFVWEKLGVLTEGGNLLELEFTTADGAVNQMTKIEIDTSERTVFASETNDIDMEYNGGDIEIVAVTYGDINNDGFVDVKDVYIARLASAGFKTLSEREFLAGDVDESGKINVIDANLIRKYIVKIIDILPIEN